MNKKNMSLALETLKIVSHPLRLSILCDLIETGEMSAGDLVANHEKQASQSQVSQYLSIMRAQGIVSTRRDGHYLYYSIADTRIKALIKTLHKLYCPDQET